MTGSEMYRSAGMRAEAQVLIHGASSTGRCNTITSQGEEPFSVGGFNRKATHYVVKVEIGGAAGIVAPLVGKQPPDVHIWILGGEAPVFLKEEGPLYDGGPIWRIEQVSPVWPRSSTEDAPKSPLRKP